MSMSTLALYDSTGDRRDRTHADCPEGADVDRLFAHGVRVAFLETSVVYRVRARQDRGRVETLYVQAWGAESETLGQTESEQGTGLAEATQRLVSDCGLDLVDAPGTTDTHVVQLLDGTLPRVSLPESVEDRFDELSEAVGSASITLAAPTDERAVAVASHVSRQYGATAAVVGPEAVASVLGVDVVVRVDASRHTVRPVGQTADALSRMQFEAKVTAVSRAVRTLRGSSRAGPLTVAGAVLAGYGREDVGNGRPAGGGSVTGWAWLLVPLVSLLVAAVAVVSLDPVPSPSAGVVGGLLSDRVLPAAAWGADLVTVLQVDAGGVVAAGVAVTVLVAGGGMFVRRRLR
jgi:hypothetical protein